MRAGGFPGNPGGLVVSIVKVAGARAPAHQARGRGRRTWRPTERTAGARMVPPGEGNEARGDGRRGVGVSHSTAEAGELRPRDPVEGRGHRQVAPLEGTMANTPRLDSVSPKRQRIAELARQASDMVFTSLAHHIDRDMLHAAYVVTRKDGAVGLDGQTADEYAANLEANLQSLLDRFKSGQYVAPPVRRVHIPKGDGRKTRPIGIPTFEDKVLQRAVVMVLESVYEQDFRDCSFGFRPGRSAHQALQHLWEQTMLMGGGWVIDLDIQGFFDALDHGHLRGFLDQRVRDGVLRRAIDKWLKAGVLEDGQVRRSVLGTPQGGVVSPLLANIYLHHVLDVWFATEVQHAFVAAASSSAMRTTWSSSSSRNLTPTGCWRCSRNASGGSGSRCIRRRADWFGSADRAWVGARGRTVTDSRHPARSTSWGSRTTGASPGTAAGCSSARRPRTASGGA